MTKKSKMNIELWAVDRLIPYEKNAKFHTEQQVESLAKVIKSQGWDVPIVVDRDGVIIKGHGRRLAAIHLGLKEVPVICRSDMTPAQVKAARLSDNRVAIGEYDADLIREELASLNVDGFDMSTVGFDQKELDMMLNDLDSLNESAFDAAKTETPVDKPADAPQSAPDAPVKQIVLTDVLGFKNVPGDAERDLVKFQSYAESMTGKTGSDAFAAFCKSVVTELEARI